MSRFHIGCSGFPVARERYHARLDFVEVDLRTPPPPPKALARWRREAPEGSTFAAVSPVSLWGDPGFPLRDPAKTRSELDRFANQVDALGAAVVVLRTPLSISPGSAALQRFLPVLTQSKRFAKTLIWEPSGLWERDSALAVAKESGAVVAGDPLHQEVDGPVIYARMRGLGTDTRYTMGRLEALAQKLEGAAEAYVVFASMNAWRESIGFRKLVDETFAAADDGADDPDMKLDDDEDEDEDGDLDEGDDDGDFEDDDSDSDDEDEDLDDEDDEDEG